MMSDLARSDVEARVLKIIKGFERIDPAKVGIKRKGGSDFPVVLSKVQLRDADYFKTTV